jgi:5-methylcytosine-specific restriction endonuclease McrA
MIPLQMGADPFDKNNLRTLCKECHKSKTKLENKAIKQIE